MADKTLRIATFNIHHCEGKGGVVDIKETAEYLKQIDADLLALQELDVGARRSRNVDQPAQLAELLGMHVYFAPTLDLDQGEYGIALASRGEFRGAVQKLPRVMDEEPRVAIVAGWRQIGVVTAHLSRSAAARKLQTERLADLAAKLGSPVVVFGDLNQRAADLAPLRAVGLKPVKARASVGQRLRFRFQIDHILTTPDVTVTKTWTVPTLVSDHDALVAEIVIQDA